MYADGVGWGVWGYGILVPGAWHQVPGKLPGTRYLVPTGPDPGPGPRPVAGPGPVGTRYLVPGTRYLGAGTGYQVPGTGKK